MKRKLVGPVLVGIVLTLIPIAALADTLYCSSSTTSCPPGTPRDDTIYGYNNRNIAYGYAGDDSLYGRDRGDDLHGGNENDELFGERGNDYILGGINYAVHDYLLGDYGNDSLKDTTRDECVGCDKDAACGDLDTATDPTGGSDTINVLDGDTEDRWYGGPGSDTVYQDRKSDTERDKHVTTYGACSNGVTR